MIRRIQVICGTGVDIIEINRIKRILENKPNFLKKLFTEKEIAHFKSRNMNISSIAGDFAAKEAVSKVLGTGFRYFEFKDIEVTRDDLGKPYINLSNKAKQIMDELGIKHIHISISHSKENAICFAIGEKE